MTQSFRLQVSVRRYGLIAAMLISPFACAVADEHAAALPFKPLLDVRARWEAVDQQGVAEEAEAGTVRARVGLETMPWRKTQLLVEGELIRAFQDDYNSGINGRLEFPAVGDPESEELNRLQLTNTALPSTTIIVGRQRIGLDDQRFVGNSGWRQNEQTFDAARVLNRAIENVTIDVSYVEQVNRVAGKESLVGRFEGNSVLANLAYETPLGKLTAFGYRLDFELLESAFGQNNVAVDDSSQTIGARFAGERSLGTFKLAYSGSFAIQEDYGRNRHDYSVDYYLAELAAHWDAFSLLAGLEVLEGTGTKGFATPLASVHRFQGWADKFVVTPVNGLEDRYASAGYVRTGLGPFQFVSAALIYHDYAAERGSSSYGTEVDAQLQVKWQRVSALLKYATYRADHLFTDTRKLWAHVEYVW